MHAQSSKMNMISESTVLSHFLPHAPLSQHAPLLEYRRTEENHNIHNIGAPAFSINSQNVFFRL